MAKMKHSKYKNTGMLFELLTRQVTSDVLNNQEKSPALKIIKESFRKGSALKKELVLYNTLLNEKYKKEDRAQYLVDVVLSERRKINNTTLRKQKYNLIKEIKNNYNLENFFRTKINNYTPLAAIYKLFEHNIKNARPAEVVRNKYTIVEHIVGNNIKPNKSANILSEYSTQDKDLRLLSYKILVDKFNEKYDGQLSKSQKALLKEYVNNGNNPKNMKSYIDGKLPKIKSALKIGSKRINDDVTKIKINEVVNQIDKISSSKTLKDNHVLSLMRVYELIKEVKDVKKL